MARLTFRTKAETLAAAAGVLRSASILPLVHFSVGEWRGGSAGGGSKNGARGRGGAPVIGRSSATAGGQGKESPPRPLLSIPQVGGKAALREASDKVSAPPRR